MQDVKNWKENWTRSDAIRFLYSESKKRRKGLGVLLMMADAAICLPKYGATFHDYMNLRFYIRSRNERSSFLTTNIVKVEKKKWNPQAMDEVDNKMKFNKLFSDLIGREWIDLDECDFEEFSSFVEKYGTFFIKSKRESSGIGVNKYSVDKIENLADFFKKNSKKGCICEETIEICEDMKRLNPYSTSQVRVVTVNNGKDVNILATTLRTGQKQNVEFNTAKDDIFSQINIETGVCFTDGIDENGIIYRKHPVSGIEFKGFQIPRWSQIINTCKEAANRVPNVTVIGWDVAITDKGCFFFEGNPGSGVASMQIADGIGKKDLFNKFLGN